MKHVIYWVLPLVFGLFATAVSNPENPIEQLAEGTTKFTVNLLKNSLEDDTENVVFSPFSLSLILSLLHQGARNGSAEQLQNLLGLPAETSKAAFASIVPNLQEEKTNVTLEWGSRIYIRNDFELLDDFKKISTENFHSVTEQMSFSTPSKEEVARKINNWVGEVTHGRINEVVEPAVFNDDTVMLLVNAIYFKGIWNDTFDKEDTRMNTFHRKENDSFVTPFMKKEEEMLGGEDEDLRLAWVELPYQDDQFSMLLVLPNERDGLQRVVNALTVEHLKKMMTTSSTRHVKLALPRFKISWKSSLQTSFEKMGLTDIFTDHANLEGLSQTHKKLRVSELIHKADIEIDEDGTTASAATYISIQMLSLLVHPDPLIFYADHPFLAFIIDKRHNIPIFAAKIKSPETVPVTE
ncbi:UNVERIFIED_CONTAM: hypothetical protein PYX00_003803 [Menopon gallinae]|uniref:Serpin domain-containing protein n=1 Tax=Menopon gallinae TaxID=328185 RepID=A0AAW2I2X7_9NEOP